MAGPTAGLGLLCRQVSHSPAGKVWATRAGLSCPLDCGRCVHTMAEHTLSPPAGTRCQRSSGSCFVPEPAGVSQAPSGRQALWVSALGGRCQGCGASARVIPLSHGWAPREGLQLLCWHLPEGLMLCHRHGWHRPAWLGDAASHRPAAVSRLSLPLRGTLVAHSGGDFKGHKKHPSPLFSPLHWGFQMDLTTQRQHHAPAPAQPTVPSSQSIAVTHKSPGPSQTKPAVTHSQRERSIALPVPMGCDVPPPWWLWHFSGEQEGHTVLRAFLLRTPALLCDFGRKTFRSKSQVPRPWASRECQQSQELAALPVPVGTSLCARRHAHSSVQSVGMGALR